MGYTLTLTLYTHTHTIHSHSHYTLYTHTHTIHSHSHSQYTFTLTLTLYTHTRPGVKRTVAPAQIGALNPLTPNDPYRGRTAPLTSKRCILYIYSTNIGTEYFKHGIYSPSFSLQNAVCFIIITYLVPVLFTFYIQGVLKLKKNNSGAKS